MLTLSRPQRQVLFTLGIVAATMAPTAIVAVTAWQVNRPGHRHDVEASLGRQLGLKVTLDGVRYPRPGEVVYTGLALWQHEPRRETHFVKVAQAGLLKIAREGRRLVLRAEGLAVAAEGPRQAMEQVGGLLSRAAADESWERVDLSADSCTLDLGDGLSYDLADLGGSFLIEGGSPTVTASYQFASTEGASTRCELKLVRDRSGEEPTTALTFQTAGDGLPLPARVLDPLFASEEWVGPSARVMGKLELSRVGAGDWRATFSGELIDVDLGTLVGRRVPEHRLDGPARLVVESAEWGPRPGAPGPGWLSASGELRAGPGAVSPGLLRALQSEMHFLLADAFRIRAVSTGNEPAVAFRDLGFRFAIEPDGSVYLDGALGDAYEPGVVMTEPDGLDPIAFAPAEGSNLIGLRRTLAPSDPVLVPADPELDFLDFLPQGGVPRSDVIRAN
ncbi:hypothetical protein [Tautonia plasticadhaerens]|uniref:AsmA-like C-terminal domain-containing protein n=1 Tax=Tautonia plasticadhaerens TaxID=2527974 RepID=A0A518H4U6_9BACT|nr:hypothetical protein [Tautonia plasticadhaerens]QDV35847.1 hypothetical protein ElP_37550 [Tautonia plasticadhaerens]